MKIRQINWCQSRIVEIEAMSSQNAHELEESSSERVNVHGVSVESDG